MSTAAKAAFDKYGATFLARGGAYEATEGKGRARNVVIEFPSLKAAQDCYHSPEYKTARAIRHKFADAEMVLVEGVFLTEAFEIATDFGNLAQRGGADSRSVTYCIAAKLR